MVSFSLFVVMAEDCVNVWIVQKVGLLILHQFLIYIMFKVLKRDGQMTWQAAGSRRRGEKKVGGLCRRPMSNDGRLMADMVM